MFRTPTQQEIQEEMRHDFSVEDPWHFRTSAHEHKRFAAMLDYIKTVPHQSILEIGCAEGFFTKMLTEISDDVTSLDISNVALERAKRYAPKANYFLSSLEEFETDRKFDLIVCSEVIYYTYDRKVAMEKLRRFGRFMVASNIVLNGIRPCSAEFIFRSLPFPKFRFVLTLRESKLTIVTLREL